jgi:hypothetical protein
LVQKRHGLPKKFWTHDGPRKKREEKKEKKRKERERKVAMFSKEFTKGERSYKRSFHPPFTIHYIHTCAHLDGLYDLFFPLGSSF